MSEYNAYKFFSQQNYITQNKGSDCGKFFNFLKI